MGAIFYIHNDSKPCCVISYFVFRDISQIVSTVFGTISMGIRQDTGCSWWFTRTLVVWLCRLFYSSHPRLYSHKLVTLIFFKTEIVSILLLLLFLFDLLLARSRNI